MVQGPQVSLWTHYFFWCPVHFGISEFRPPQGPFRPMGSLCSLSSVQVEETESGRTLSKNCAFDHCRWMMLLHSSTMFPLICETIVFWWYRSSQKYPWQYQEEVPELHLQWRLLSHSLKLSRPGRCITCWKICTYSTGSQWHAKAWRTSTSKALRKSKIFDDLWISWWFSGSRDTRTTFL